MGGNRRYKDAPALVPTWAGTVGAMLANKVLVYATCTECGFYKRHVDLEAIQAKFGEGFSLFDCHPPCPGKGCRSHILFMYSPGASTPVRKCSTSRA